MVVSEAVGKLCSSQMWMKSKQHIVEENCIWPQLIGK